MKKSLKIIGGILLSLIVLGNLGRLIAKSTIDNSLEEQVRRANRDCPIPVSNGVGEVSSITLQDGFLTYDIKFKPGYCDIEAFRNNPEGTKDMFYLIFVCMGAQGPQASMMLDELTKRQIGIRAIISDGNGKSFTSDMTPEYMEGMKHKVDLNPSEALHNALAMKLAIESGELPIQAEEGMWITAMDVEADNIVLTCRVDENIYDIALSEGVKAEFAQSLLDEANSGDPELGAFFDLCKVSHTGLTYRMVGDKTGKKCDLNISSNLIREQRHIPHQVNIH